MVKTVFFVITPHAQRERGKVIDRGVHIYNWASEASPTLGCSIEISRDIYMYIYMCVCRMSNHVESRESNTRMLNVSIGR